MGKLVKGITGGLTGFATGGWAGAAAGAAGGLLSKSPKGGTSATAAGFTPYSIKSGIATSSVDPRSQTATYTLTPEMQAFRDKYYAGATNALPTPEELAYGQQVSDYGQSLFGQAANLDTAQMTADYYNQQQALLNPSREQAASQLKDRMFSQGTLGAGIGMGGGYVNPQQFAAQQAIEQQNAQLALGAEDRARAIQGEQFQRAGALYGLGQSYQSDPYTTANTIMGYGTGIENLGANVLTQGLNVGMGVSGLNNAAASSNANINQQNYLNSLAKSNANQAAWTSGANAIGNIDWGGLFGGQPINGQFGNNGAYDYLGRY